MKCKSKPQWDVTSFLLRWLLSKSQNENKCFWGCGKKGTLVHCWWEYKLVQSLWKTVWRFFKKVKIELPYEPATLLLVIYLQSTKSLPQRDLCTPTFTAALCTIWSIPHGVTYIWNLSELNSQKQHKSGCRGLGSGRNSESNHSKTKCRRLCGTNSDGNFRTTNNYSINFDRIIIGG